MENSPHNKERERNCEAHELGSCPNMQSINSAVWRLSVSLCRSHMLRIITQLCLSDLIGFLWLRWDARNKANAGDRIMSTEEMVFNVHSMKYVDTLRTHERPNKRQSGISCWVPQTADDLKIIIDRAFIQKEKKGA